jgi:hypothetical protein
MAYFPNGTAGMVYQESYCDRCLNNVDKGDGRGRGCAVWDAHTLWSYEAAGKGEVAGAKRAILNLLIPEDENAFPKECAMFRDDGKDHRTLPMFPEGGG